MVSRPTAGNILPLLRRQFALREAPPALMLPTTSEEELRDALQDFDRESERIRELALEQLGFLQLNGLNNSLDAHRVLLEEMDRFIRENKDALAAAGLLPAARVLRTALRFGEIEITEFQTFGTDQVDRGIQNEPLGFFQRRDFLRIASQKDLPIPPSIQEKFNNNKLTTKEASDFIGPVPQPQVEKELSADEVGISGVSAETADLALSLGSPVSQFDAVDVARVIIFSDQFPQGTLATAMRAAEVLGQIDEGDYVLDTEQFTEIQRLELTGAIELTVTEGLRFDRLLLTRKEAQAIIQRSTQ